MPERAALLLVKFLASVVLLEVMLGAIVVGFSGLASVPDRKFLLGRLSVRKEKLSANGSTI